MHHATRATFVFLIVSFAAFAQAAPTVGLSGDLDPFAAAVTIERAARQAVVDGGDKRQRKFVKAFDAVLAVLAKPATSATYRGEMAAAATVVHTLDVRRVLDDSVRTPLAAVPPLYLADLETARTALSLLVPTLAGKPRKAAAKRLAYGNRYLTKAAKYSTPSKTLPLYATAAKFLLPVPGSKEPDGLTLPAHVAIDAGGKFLYVTESGDSTQNGSYVGAVRQMRIEADGSLSDLSPKRVSAGTTPNGIAAHPTGAFLYVASSDDGAVSQFAIGADGRLSPRVPPQVAVSTGIPRTLEMDPSGRVLFVLGYTPGGPSLTAFTIGVDGRLTEQQTQFAAQYGGFVSAQPTNGGKTFVFTTGGGDGPSIPPELRTFQTSQAGEVAYADVLQLHTPASEATVYFGDVFADPSRFIVYSTRSSGTLVPFTVGETGTVVELPGGAAACGPYSQAMAMNPAHDRIYVACSRPDEIWQFSVAADGSLAALSTAFVASPSPFDMAMNPAGTRLYVMNGSATGAASNVVSVFSVAPDGTLGSN